MVLPVAKQNTIFELFYERNVEAVDAAKQRGAFDFGVSEIRARNLRNARPPQTLHVDESSGARTVLHELEGEIDVERYEFDTARCRFAVEGFYRNNRGGPVYGVSAHHDDSLRQAVLMSVKRSSRIVVERHELAAKYTRVGTVPAREWWNAAYASTPATATEKFYVLSGAIIPVYDKIMGGQGIDNTKVARAILENGEALVGFNLSPKDVGPVKQRLGIGNPLSESTAEEILDLVDGGGIVELDNGWRIALSIVSGESVVELVLNGVIGNKEEIRGYGFVDETIHYKRRWFARPDDADAVLTRLLSRSRPVRDIALDPAA